MVVDASSSQQVVSTDADPSTNPAHPYDGASWRCNVCAKANPGPVGVCGVCGRSRGHIAPLHTQSTLKQVRVVVVSGACVCK